MRGVLAAFLLASASAFAGGARWIFPSAAPLFRGAPSWQAPTRIIPYQVYPTWSSSNPYFWNPYYGYYSTPMQQQPAPQSAPVVIEREIIREPAPVQAPAPVPQVIIIQQPAPV